MNTAIPRPGGSGTPASPQNQTYPKSDLNPKSDLPRPVSAINATSASTAQGVARETMFKPTVV